MSLDILNNKYNFIQTIRDHLGRLAKIQFLRSPTLGTMFYGQAIEQIMLVPQDLRTADPSFTTEYYHGHFGLSGVVADTRGASPFSITPPNKAWQRELHGFGWLRHFNTSQSQQALLQAKELTYEWIKKHSKKNRVSWEPEIVSRRIISWLSHVSVLLEDDDDAFYDQVMKSLTQQIHYLSASYQDIPDGQPRLTALIALNLAGLCTTGQDNLLDKHLPVLCHELKRQILDDGGHVSRNPWIPVSLMFDLLPLKQCFVSRGLEIPDVLTQSLKTIPSMIRFLRLGDGCLAHFNGMAATLPDMLATVLAYDDYSENIKNHANKTAYSRMEIASTVVLADTGAPPDLSLSNEAHAGCLSFEMSSGIYPLIINCGAPSAVNREWHLTARTTPYHSTLSINKNSSAKLLKNNLIHKYLGSSLLKGPKNVTVECTNEPDKQIINANHDGFADRYNAIYSRKLILSKNGNLLEGHEHLWPYNESPSKQKRFPFALHFHFHPDIDPTFSEDRKKIVITLLNGETWHFSTTSLVPAIEESLFFADYRGIRRTLQIVLRGVCNAKAKFTWKLEKVKVADKEGVLPTAPAIKSPSRMAQIQKKLIFTDLKDDAE